MKPDLILDIVRFGGCICLQKIFRPICWRERAIPECELDILMFRTLIVGQRNFLRFDR